MKIGNPYRAAGTFSGTAYVERTADAELLAEIRQNRRFPYLLAPRQSGKSSLILRAMQRLQREGLDVALVDLSTFSPEAIGREGEFARSLMLCLRHWLKVELKAGVEPSIGSAIDAVLAAKPASRVVVFIDEVDRLIGTSLANSVLGQVRSLFNERAWHPDYERVQVVLAGAARPEQLISNPNQSPFNVGRAIELTDLTLQQTEEMCQHLPLPVRARRRIAEWVFENTRGSVYLAQFVLEVCWDHLSVGDDLLHGLEAVDAAVSQIVSNWRNDVHFAHMRALLDDPGLDVDLEKLRHGGRVDGDGVGRLALSGLVDREGRVRNPLYGHVFLGFELPMRRREHAPDHRAWQFEERVARLYEVLGYRVSRRIDLRGLEVDLAIERDVAGVGPQRFAVECKYRAHGKVSAQAVFDCAALAAGITPDYGGVIIVSSSGFSRSAEAAAARTSVRLITLESLEQELIGPQEAIRDFARAFEASDLHRTYVELTCDTDDRPSVPVLEAFDTLAKSRYRGIVVVMGGPGGGKTALLNVIKHRLAKSLISGSEVLRPVLFELSRWEECGSLEEFVRTTVRSEIGGDVPTSYFWQAARRGALALLLDGWDEASARDGAKHARFRREIGPLLSAGSLCFVTCRSGYGRDAAEVFEPAVPDFESSDHRDVREELRSILLPSARKHGERHGGQETPYRVWQLCPLSDQQVEEFVLSHIGAGGDERIAVRQWLAGVYGARDLMRQPLLASMALMAAQTLGVNALDRSLGAAELYGAFVEIQLRRERQKGVSRELVSRHEFVRLMEDIAKTMHDEHSLALDRERVVELVRDVVGEVRGGLPVDDVARELKVAPFLSVDTLGGIRFMHRSFQEYFVARALVRSLAERPSLVGLDHELSPMVIDFMAGIIVATAACPRDEIGKLDLFARRSAPDARSSIQALKVRVNEMLQRRERRRPESTDED